MKKDKLLQRVDELIALASAALGSIHTYGDSTQQFLADEPVAELRSAGLSFLASTVGSGHPYYKDFDKQTDAAWPATIKGARGTLKALRGDIEGDWLTSMRGLVSAEIFSDFLDMAEHLLNEGYKDPAAVLLGGVLEERLRQLAILQEIPVSAEKGGATTPRKASSLNQDLGKTQRYNLLQQKTITAWLDLRNKAAHGHFDEYSAEQVQNFKDGLKHFILSTTE